MIVGCRVRLRQPECISDHELIVAWRNDPAVKPFFFQESSISLESHLSWYERTRTDPTQHYFLIESLVSPASDMGAGDNVPLERPLPIGTIGLAHIDPSNRSAELGRLLVGRPEYRREGFAREAEFLLMDFAFDCLDVHKVWAEVILGNEAALSLYRKVGFVEEGVLRQQIVKDGRYVDIVRIGLLAEDFRELEPSLREAIGLPPRTSRGTSSETSDARV
jgi:RimJ/RimL family protein N-acetyltransferase